MKVRVWKMKSDRRKREFISRVFFFKIILYMYTSQVRARYA